MEGYQIKISFYNYLMEGYNVEAKPKEYGKKAEFYFSSGLERIVIGSSLKKKAKKNQVYLLLPSEFNPGIYLDIIINEQELQVHAPNVIYASIISPKELMGFPMDIKLTPESNLGEIEYTLYAIGPTNQIKVKIELIKQP